MLIGGVLTAMAHPSFRRWPWRFVGITVVGFARRLAFALVGSARALARISAGAALGQADSVPDWATCVQMFLDTCGLGTGSGGCQDPLPSYNAYVAGSLYDYPRGISWAIVALWGMVGLALLGWPMVSVTWMVRQTVLPSRGTAAEVSAWTMPAALVGYAARSFVERTVTEKPSLEFLALCTPLHLAPVRQRRERRA